MGENVKQHYVPKFYLKNFATSGNLYVFDKPTGTWNPEPSTPKAEARAEHFNTIEIDGSPSYMFDSFLTEIEDKASGIVYQVVAQKRLPTKKEDKAHLARFIASTAFRTPGHRNFFRQVVPMLFGSVMESMHAEEFDSLSGLNGLLDQMLMPAMEQLLSEGAMIAMIPANSLYVAEIVYRRKWHLILAEKDGPHFVTSDNPVTGLLSQDVAVPLSPWVAVLASDRVDGDVIQGDNRYVRALNWMTYDNALTSVYAHQPEERFLQEMEALGRKPEFKSVIAHVKEALRNP